MTLAGVAGPVLPALTVSRKLGAQRALARTTGHSSPDASADVHWRVCAPPVEGMSRAASRACNGTATGLAAQEQRWQPRNTKLSQPRNSCYAAVALSLSARQRL